VDRRFKRRISKFALNLRKRRWRLEVAS